MALIMSFVTRYIQTIQESSRFGCNMPGAVILLIALFSSLFMILGYGILTIHLKVKVHTIREATFRGVLDIFTNLCFLCMMNIFAFYLLAITYYKHFIHAIFT